MRFPPLSDIIAAVQDGRFIKDPFFDNYSVVTLESGRPSMFGGGFSQVFQMGDGVNYWALKVWTHEIRDNRERYASIKKYLTSIDLPYFVDFEYVTGGLLVDGQRLDTLRMPWMNCLSLKHYINNHIDDPEVLKTLAFDFLNMTIDLHEKTISHGDLQYQNIFVTNEGNIKLIDYDSICIPELEGEPDICLGTQGYQHPSRYTAGFFSSTKIDHFSELIIYLSILALSENKLLWEKYEVMNADYRLLFRLDDFYSFDISNIRRDLMVLSEGVQILVKKLDIYLASHLLLTPIAG